MARIVWSRSGAVYEDSNRVVWTRDGSLNQYSLITASITIPDVEITISVQSITLSRAKSLLRVIKKPIIYSIFTTGIVKDVI